MSLGARSQGEKEGRCVVAGVVSGQEGREIADLVEEGGGQSRRHYRWQLYDLCACESFHVSCISARSQRKSYIY